MKSKGMYAALLSPDDIIKYNFDVVSGQFNIFSDQKVVLTQHIFERKKTWSVLPCKPGPEIRVRNIPDCMETRPEIHFRNIPDGRETEAADW